MKEKVKNLLKEKVLVGEYEVTTCDELHTCYFVVAELKDIVHISSIGVEGVEIIAVNNFKGMTVHFTIDKEVLR